VYGSTRQYAEALAAQLEVTAGDLYTPGSVSVAPGDPIVVLAPIHGPRHDGVAFIKNLPREVVDSNPIALVTVGMSIDAVAATADAAGNLLGQLSDRVTRFYVPGRLNYSQLSPKHSAVMKGIVGALRVKPRKSDNERSMIDMFGKDTDRVDLARLEPVVEWVEQRA